MKLFYHFLTILLLALLSLSIYVQGDDIVSQQIKLETNHGDIVIALNTEKAPDTVSNFLAYVEDGFYDDTIFHRVIKDFMVQGGGFTADLVQKQTKAAIKNEASNGLSNVRGSIAMARTSDPHSATAQFFINTVDNEFLDFRDEQRPLWGYAVFGQVVEGMDIVDSISNTETGSKGPFTSDAPVDDVIIIKASVVNK